MKLKNKVAVVTGGNSGIGLAIAKQLSGEGASVVISGRNQETLDKAVIAIGNGTLAFKSDVSRIAEISDLFEATAKKHDKIDVLVVNAGVVQVMPTEEADEAHFDFISDINFKGAYFTVQKALPYLADGASIILVSSAANQMGFPGMSVYSATKAAVRSLARTLSAELLPRGIRVNVLSPGPVKTPMLDNLSDAVEGFEDQMASIVPMKRIGTPEEIGKAALFLATNDSSYVTGIDLAVDGGASQL